MWKKYQINSFNRYINLSIYLIIRYKQNQIISINQRQWTINKKLKVKLKLVANDKFNKVKK